MSKDKDSTRRAQEGWRRLLDYLEADDEVLVLRPGVEVGKPVRPERKSQPLPDLSRFRASIKLRGRPLSQDVQETRRSSRF